MFYCPKCQQTYEETAQRFCLKDGARLLPAPSSGKSVNQAGGVFAKILNRNQENVAKDVASANSYPSFSPPAGKMFKSEEDLLSLPDISAPPPKPLPRTIKTSEVPMSQASLGDRKINPTGRPALSWENPNVLVQQTIKNRYLIVKKLDQDEGSIGYLAEDKLVPNKKVLVRILMEQDTSDKFTNKIFAEERVSLSHINHPNVANVIDSGELLEGNPFIITEYVEGTSVRDMLNRKGEFNALRTGRIIRQISNALSEIHQNGVLHRNLKPENIVLIINEEGGEQVKLINFGMPNARANKENLAFKSPEQLEGNVATFASDIYSLAVIAYQMLTGRFPFNASSVSQMLKAQREGMTLQPTNLRLDLPPITDAIFERALAFSPSARYPKARDFGDAFYNSINSSVASAEKSEKLPEPNKFAIPVSEKIEENVRKAISQTDNTSLLELPAQPIGNVKDDDFELELLPIYDEAETRPTTPVQFPVQKPSVAPPVPVETVFVPPAPQNFVDNRDFADEETREDEVIENEIPKIQITESEIKTPKDLTWEKRSPEPPKVASSSKTMLALLGVTVLLAGMFAVWYYVWNRPNNQLAQIATENVNTAIQNTENAPVANFNVETKSSPKMPDIEVPPPARTISQPPNTVFFETNKENLKGDLLRNFVGFSLFYPKDWVKNEAANNFIDIAKKSDDGKPLEQLLVSYYESNGTFNADKENFTKFVEKSNKDLAKIIPNYQSMSEGETRVNGDWRAYEVRFQGGGKIENGEKNLIIWGRRIWIPAARPGTKNGFVVTMLATSLSPEINSVDDVGVKGDLGTVFGTFEPNQNF